MTGPWRRGAALLFPLLLACAPEPDRTPRTAAPAGEDRRAGSAAVVAVPEEPDLLAPPLARGPAAAAYWTWILPSLVRPARGAPGEARFARDLAADWVVEPDGRAARFVLRTDRLW
ncbi:MAG: hypothetical protein GF346_00285, partial [Candidatus Eisenbacteria bacterium]|nr:hypothetical protein [Candidatus Latescibacterota bacterium]MBD3300870.1 hypothetical protein [Candidatus Eisenbacteria bacterium]